MLIINTAQLIWRFILRNQFIFAGMQANAGISEVNTNGGVNKDIMPDAMSVPTSAPSQASSSVNQQQPQQLRPPISPNIQQQQPNQSNLPADVVNAPNQSSGSTVHHHVSQSQGLAYHTTSNRHSQSYHNQQHQQIQHYHNQHNKYSPRVNNESNVNHVLLITVINPHYTITCDLIHQICSTYGKVNRIVIFKKNGVQAMVEFDNVESAKRAKATLYGCDIYSGCCTLRIEYAKPSRLNIHRNDNDSFDYTNPNLGTGQDAGSSSLNNEQHIHSTGTSGTGPHHHSSVSHGPHHHQSHGHQSRGAGIVRGGGMGANLGGGGGGQHNQHFHPSHHHHPQANTSHHHVQQSVNHQHGPNTSSGSYGIASTPIDQQTPATADAFHQDSGFHVSRGGPGAYGQVSVDSYIPTSHGGHHGNPYSSPRQDNHQHHHARSALSGGHNHSSSFSSANTSNALMPGPANHLAPPQGTVMMVYGLQPERLNCDRLFNLFCLYGNVARIKFLRTKEGCAMVQMGDVLAVDRCVSSLNKITLFGSELQISYSKQAFLHDVIQPFILPDGSPSFKDFMGNKNNRFKNPEVASKNRILPPSQVLHFFSAPFGISEDELVHLFKQTSGHEPVSIKIFTPKADNSKSFSGLVTFKDPADATEALVMCNHLNVPKPGAPHPYILRLCFSPPSYMRQPPQPSYAAPSN